MANFEFAVVGDEEAKEESSLGEAVQRRGDLVAYRIAGGKWPKIGFEDCIDYWRGLGVQNTCGADSAATAEFLAVAKQLSSAVAWSA